MAWERSAGSVGSGGRQGQYISFAAVKEATDLAALVGECGIEINRSKMAHCPFHDDARPSLLVKGGRWRCFGCGENGDVFDWCERYYRMDTGMALDYLARRAGIAPGYGEGRAEVSPEVLAAKRRNELRDAFFSWISDERGRIGARIWRLEKAADRFVATPDDLSTDMAKFIYDRLAGLEGIDRMLWDRDYDEISDYYREKMRYGF